MGYITIIIIILIVLLLLYFGYKYFFSKNNNKLIKDNSNNENFENNENNENNENKKNKVFINEGNPYFNIKVGEKEPQKIVFELFDDEAPKTCKNFRYLCSKSVLDKDQADYKNTIFHRVIKDFMIQGGDTTNFDGTGGKSIYGDKFEDENFNLSHNQPGLLCMANSGPNTNGSQFYITLKSTPWLDNKHVVFGIVSKGYDVVKEIENVECDENDCPNVKIEIIECGLE